MPAEARTTTEIVVTTRMAQRGFFLRTGGRTVDRSGGRRERGGCGRLWGRGCGRAGERGGVGKGDTSAGVNVGIREHRRPIRSAARPVDRAARARVPHSR
ncbi:hypothetical protein GCM10010317_062120 [Streptomyces mirabilis]|nr:hypothetical protein GCM10010317_062120 [Streptomyces mirabilis]